MCVTSSVIATSGSSAKAAVRAPAYDVSSRTDATAIDLGLEIARRCRAARRLEHDERAEPVVERARGEARAAQLDRLGRHHDRIADLHRRGGVGLVARADVDPEVVHLRHALAILLAQEVPRGLAHDAGHGPGRPSSP